MLTPGELSIGQLVAIYEWKEPVQVPDGPAFMPFAFPNKPNRPIAAGYPARVKAIALPFVQLQTDRGTALVDTRECAIMEVPKNYAEGYVPKERKKK